MRRVAEAIKCERIYRPQDTSYTHSPRGGNCRNLGSASIGGRGRRWSGGPLLILGLDVAVQLRNIGACCAQSEEAPIR